jgi:hypothetical protein
LELDPEVRRVGRGIEMHITHFLNPRVFQIDQNIRTAATDLDVKLFVMPFSGHAECEECADVTVLDLG